MSSDVLQQLLVPDQVTRIRDEGAQVLGGFVVRAGDVSPITDPRELLDAHGLAGAAPYGPDPDAVYVIRFPVTPLLRLQDSRERATQRPWPTYERGFLPAEVVVPVWWLHTTRVPAGSEVWRLRAGGGEELVLQYRGPAAGWHGGRAWAPPLAFVGPHARWEGREFLAAYGAQDPAWIELVAYEELDGFERARAQVWHRMVPAADCDVFEVVLTAEHRGQTWRVLHRQAGRVLLELDTDDPEVAAQLGATMTDPGRFELEAAETEVTPTGGTTVEATAGAES